MDLGLFLQSPVGEVMAGGIVLVVIMTSLMAFKSDGGTNLFGFALALALGLGAIIAIIVQLSPFHYPY